MNSIMLKRETPRNSPSNPPHTAKKSVGVYFSVRFSVITSWSRNDTVIVAGRILQTITKRNSFKS